MSTPAASWLPRETLSVRIADILFRHQSILLASPSADTSSATSMAAALAILSALYRRINGANPSVSFHCNAISENAPCSCQAQNRAKVQISRARSIKEQTAPIQTSAVKARAIIPTYDTLRIYLPTYGTYEAVSDHIYGTKFWTSHSFMCIVSRISMYYVGLWYKGILCDQKQIHQCFRTTSGPISS